MKSGVASVLTLFSSAAVSSKGPQEPFYKLRPWPATSAVEALCSWRKASEPSLWSAGEYWAKALLLACCYQERSNE